MPRTLTPAEIEAFRDALCDVATRLFVERGFEGVTLRALASELGCSAMTPYRYFESRDQIFEAVRDRAFQRLGDRCTKVASTVADPVQRFRELGRTYVRFALDEPHAYQIMFALGRPLPEVDAPEPDGGKTLVVPALENSWSLLVQTVTEAVKQGALEGDPLDLAHVAWSALHGLVTLHFSDRLRFGRDLDHLLEPLLDNLIRGATRRA